MKKRNSKPAPEKIQDSWTGQREHQAYFSTPDRAGFPSSSADGRQASAPKALYQKIKEYILEQIHSGNWPPESRVPSENQIVELLGVSRMTYSMARRGDLPKILSKLHPKFCTPYISIIIIGLTMTTLVYLVDLAKVVAISSFASLFYYSIANYAAIKLGNERKIKYKIISTLGLISCLIMLFLIFFISPESWIFGISCLGIGSLYYILRSRKRIKINQVVKVKTSTNSKNYKTTHR